MPEHRKFTPYRLTRYTESLRRELYDAAVQFLWTAEDPGDYVPPFTPEEAQLTVSFEHGRWLLSYIDLEEPTDAPPDRRTVLSRILAAPDRPFGIMLSEI